VSLDAGVQGNEITDKLAKDCSVQNFVQPEPSLGPLGRKRKEKQNSGWIASIW